MHESDKIWVGWEEWCALDGLGLPAIKAKIDTGAKTSALHAYNIRCFYSEGIKHVQFEIHPVQRTAEFVRKCTARVVDRRLVSDSGGYRELRYVILTPVRLGEKTWLIEITLTNRDTMSFRMLLGREAMRHQVVIDPSKSCILGKMTFKQVRRHYKDGKKKKA